jgi:xanthine dehydrogenase/oxidase
VFISETATDKVANTSPTAASASSDMYGMALLDACKQLNERLEPVRRAHLQATWAELIDLAWLERIDLTAHGFYQTPCLDNVDLGKPGARGRPFFYYTNGAAVSEVEVDCLTGQHEVLRTHIVMDVGRPLNPAIDIGQIEGAFVQGLGWCTLEEVVRGGPRAHSWLRSGQMHTLGPGAYKIPGFRDIPRAFHVRVLDGVRNEKDTIHSSKAIGEPPLFLAASVFFAIRHAISAARAEAGVYGWFELDSPASVERIRAACPQLGTDGTLVAPVDHRPDLSL